MTLEYFWRPGCPFCIVLTPKIRRLGVPVVEHNIWEEPDAAARVREVAGGNETVPTVLVGERALVNPSIRAVRATIREQDPNAPVKPSLWQRLRGR